MKKRKQLLRRPLRSTEELEQLASYLRSARARLKTVFWTWLGVVVFFAVINLTSTDSNAPAADRYAPLMIGVLVAAFLTPYATRRLWTWPRLLTAQHRLFKRQSDLEVLGDEIGRLVTVLRPRLEASGESSRVLVRAERRARQLLDRLEFSTAMAASTAAARRQQLRLRIESFRVALAGIEIDTLLQPGSEAGEGIREELIRASALLD